MTTNTRAPVSAEDALESLTGCREFHLDDPLGRAGGDNLATAVPTFGPEIEDPIGHLDDIQIVLDYDYRVAQINQAVQDVQELFDIVKVKAGRGLIENVQRPAGGTAAELARQFDPLRLAA